MSPPDIGPPPPGDIHLWYDINDTGVRVPRILPQGADVALDMIEGQARH
jgi:hypothetical protein